MPWPQRVDYPYWHGDSLPLRFEIESENGLAGNIIEIRIANTLIGDIIKSTATGTAITEDAPAGNGVTTTVTADLTKTEREALKKGALSTYSVVVIGAAIQTAVWGYFLVESQKK